MSLEQTQHRPILKQPFHPHVASTNRPPPVINRLSRRQAAATPADKRDLSTQPLNPLGRPIATHHQTRRTRTVRSGNPSQCLRYRSAVYSGPTNGFGTPTTSLKQSDVMPAIKVSMSRSLSAPMCSRKTAIRFDGRAMSVFMRRTILGHLRRRTGTVPMWFSWVACFSDASASSSAIYERWSSAQRFDWEWRPSFWTGKFEPSL